MAHYTVLVVEDEESLRHNLARIAMTYNYVVLTAANGEEACAMLLTHEIDIVLSDLRMPRLDGYALLKWMQAHDCIQPVIVISGNGMIESAIAALRLGAYDYITKPFEIEDVEAALHRATVSITARRADATLRQRNRELAALTTISAAVSSSLDLPHMLQQAIPMTMDMLGVSGALVYLGDPSGMFSFHSSYGQLQPLPAWATDHLHEQAGGQVVIGAAHVVQVLSASHPEAREDLLEPSLEALVPLLARGVTLGVVLLAGPAQGSISSDQIELLQSIGSIIGVGVSNASVYGAIYTSAVHLEELVTQRTRELQRSRDLLSTIFDGIPSGLLLLDGDGKVLIANRAYAAIVGQQHSTLTGIAYDTLWSIQHKPSTNGQLQRFISEGRPFYQRTRLERDGQSPLVVDRYLLPVPDDVAGQSAQVIEYLENVTERLALEQVVAQTEQLAALGKLAATVAHEVNTPLLAIRGCVSLAADSGSDEATRAEYLALAQGELDRAASIIQGMLNFYRPAGNERIATDLNALCAQVLQLLRVECEQRDIKVVKRLERGLPPVLGAPDQLKQVLLNLVINAIEAIGSEGTLTVLTTYSAYASDNESDDTLMVEVRDTGSGIPEELMKTLFHAFVTTKSDGNGLGLSVCNTIVRDHGGTISAANLPTGGARFTVKLPVA